MKLIKQPKDISEPHAEYVLMTEDNEDMWHMYNLITPGDLITCKTTRKVINESATGSISSEKVTTRLTIEVETIEWETDTCTLRLKGPNREENQFIRLGQYHSLEVKSHMTIGIKKPEWDSQHVERIKLACNPASDYSVAAIVMENGLAHICLITKHMTIVKAKVELSIPKKRAGPSGHDKAVQRFYTLVAEALHANITMSGDKCLLIASPSFVGDEFLTFLLAKAKKENWTDITVNARKIKVVHAANGHKHALMEAMQNPEVKRVISDTSAMVETELMEKFMELMNTCPDRAYYGWDDVVKVADMGAIETLMISDALFRNPDVHVRSKYVNLVDRVKRQGGANVAVFSAANISGEQLTQITGIAAILKYPVEDIDEEEQRRREENTVVVDSLEELEKTVNDMKLKEKEDKKKDKSKKKSKKSKGTVEQRDSDVMYL